MRACHFKVLLINKLINFHWLLWIWVCFPLGIEFFLGWTCFYLIIWGFPWCELDENHVGGIWNMKKNIKSLLKRKNCLGTMDIHIVFSVVHYSWQPIHCVLCIIFFKIVLVRRWNTSPEVLGPYNINIDSPLYSGNAVFCYKIYRGSCYLKMGLFPFDVWNSEDYLTALWPCIPELFKAREARVKGAE